MVKILQQGGKIFAQILRLGGKIMGQDLGVSWQGLGP